MKKLILLICLTCVFKCSLQSQLVYRDAVELSRFLVDPVTKPIFKNDDVSKEAIAKILVKYTKFRDRDSVNVTTVLAAFESGKSNANPIIQSFIPTSAALAGSDFRKTFQTFTKGLGGIDVSNFVDGLARFLVERSKEELNVAFFRQFKKFLNNYPEAKIVFPATVKVMEVVLTYNYTAMLPALRAAFNKDLTAFDTQLLNLREISAYETTKPEVKARAEEIVKFLNETVAGRAACATVLLSHGIITGDHIADVITTLTEDKLCTPQDNLSNGIFFVDLLSKSLRSSDDNPDWISTDDIKIFVKDPQVFHLFLGLLYSMDKLEHNVKFQTGASTISFQSLLSKVHDKWTDSTTKVFINRFIEMSRKGAQVTNEISSLRLVSGEDKSSQLTQYAGYTAAVAQFLEKALDLIPHSTELDATLDKLQEDFKKFSSLVSMGTDCAEDIKSQNYSTLVFHVSLLLDQLLPNSNRSTEFVTDFLKYGTFAANVVEADSPEEVKAAIEAAVLPVGSSSIKRETLFNVSLNAYLGVFGGSETMYTLKEKKSGFVMGATAPVGVAISWGRLGHRRSSRSDTAGASITLFVPVIDIGAMAAFRLKDDQTKVASQVLLKNIIAPGLYVYYGIPNWPVSIGAGGQLGPQLREVTADAVDINQNKNYYFRFGINIVVDIPLLNFHTKN